MTDVVVQWLHLMAAMAWVGGMLAMSLVVQPAMRREMRIEERMTLYRAMGRRFSYLKWGAWITLAATGAYKLWSLRGSRGIFISPWGAVLAVKLSLVVLMVGLSELHSQVWGPQLVLTPPEDPRYDLIAARMSFWGKVNLCVIAAIVFCAAMLRVNPFQFS